MDIRNLDNAVMATALQTDVFALFDALDVAITDTNLKRFCACQNGVGSTDV